MSNKLGCYPARLKKVLIVTAPLWFKAPFKVLRLFVREKLRDRVFTVSLPQLVLHIPPTCLPKGTAIFYNDRSLPEYKLIAIVYIIFEVKTSCSSFSNHFYYLFVLE